jgi:type II secretory ATPase GspE/PulE/Tfp pilus assembly ATPase PilB-like protein
MPIQEIGNILLESKVVSREQLDFALMIQKNLKPEQRLGRVLKYYNFASDEDIAMALSKQVGWRYFNKKYVVNLAIVEKLGLDTLIDRVFLPVETEKGLCFVFAYPFDTEITDLLASEGLQDKEFYIGSEGAIRQRLELLKKQKKIKEIEKRISQIKETGIVGNELKELLDELLDDAIIQNATDIHIEPEEKISTIRFRIDGILYFKFCIPLEVHNNLINVVFSRAEITVSDFYKFHDARFEHSYSDHPVDVRVSCIPSIYGPALVLRLLDVNKTLITLENLGFHKSHFAAISKVITKPHGIIIITGPTGSGKTTSLYAILNQLKSISTKVITIEDPVEIKMPLINQVQINEKQGITFAHATRAFLRHDPNIILIGEIRDSDTAQEAIRAAITGHRVLSTLHTNSAVDSVYRLHDLGIELSHIANSILCVISQRLIRKLCIFCRRKVAVKKDDLPEFFKKYLREEENEVRVYRAKGCPHCQTGYRGRTVIAEVLCFNEEIRELIACGKLDNLRHKSKETGFIDLQQDAVRLVREGVTRLEEAERIAG